MRTSFLTPLARQLLGALCGMVAALLLYGAYKGMEPRLSMLFPSHGAARPGPAEERGARMDRIVLDAKQRILRMRGEE